MHSCLAAGYHAQTLLLVIWSHSGAQRDATEASLAQSPGAWHLNALRSPPRKVWAW
jgi:hypothetical protein